MTAARALLHAAHDGHATTNARLLLNERLQLSDKLLLDDCTPVAAAATHGYVDVLNLLLEDSLACR